jgi:hypothetical protein
MSEINLLSRVLVGLTSNHMEVKWDLAIGAMATIREHGILAVRLATRGA